MLLSFFGFVWLLSVDVTVIFKFVWLLSSVHVAVVFGFVWLLSVDVAVIFPQQGGRDDSLHSRAASEHGELYQLQPQHFQCAWHPHGASWPGVHLAGLRLRHWWGLELGLLIILFLQFFFFFSVSSWLLCMFCIVWLKSTFPDREEVHRSKSRAVGHVITGQKYFWTLIWIEGGGGKGVAEGEV